MVRARIYWLRARNVKELAGLVKDALGGMVDVDLSEEQLAVAKSAGALAYVTEPGMDPSWGSSSKARPRPEKPDVPSPEPELPSAPAAPEPEVPDAPEPEAPAPEEPAPKTPAKRKVAGAKAKAKVDDSIEADVDLDL